MLPEIAAAQRELVDQQLQQDPLPIQFRALADAVRSTQCPGELWEVGCASGYNREVLDRQGIAYRSYGGCDISPAAIKVALERYPESEFVCFASHDRPPFDLCGLPSSFDVVIDGCALMHADDWKIHLADLCARSRRWVILHRVPLAIATKRTETHGYGQTFRAWDVNHMDLMAAMAETGFQGRDFFRADGGSTTYVCARPRVYATYADSNYITRLKALHASMLRHCQPFELHILSWDEGVRDWAESVGCPTQLPGTIGILPGPERTRVETMWTLGPWWIAEVMKSTGRPVCYVDADIMFHSSPEPVFAEIGAAPAAVFPHNFASASHGLPGPTVETHEVFGKYNVGLVYIANREIVEEWAAQCREWCYDRVEQVPIPERQLRYGDQKYLDAWPEKHGAHVVMAPGANLGPWAIHGRALDVRGGVPYFGNRSLVAFHYSGYRELADGHTVITRPEYQVTKRQGEIIYRPYVEELERQR